MGGGAGRPLRAYPANPYGAAPLPARQEPARDRQPIGVGPPVRPEGRLDTVCGVSDSTTAAFFDLDKTLMAGSSGMEFARVARRRGLISRVQIFKWARDHFRYRLRGATDEQTNEVLKMARDTLSNVPAREIERMWPEVLAGVLPRIYPEMLAEIHSQQDAGRQDLHRQRRRARPGRGDRRCTRAWTAGSARAT